MLIQFSLILDQIKTLLSKIKINFALIGFFLYLTKMLLIEPTYPEVIAFMSVVALYGFKMKFQLMEPKDNSSKHKIELDKVKEELQIVKSVVSKLSIDKINKPKYF